MVWQLDWRKVATGCAVLLLHILILLALLTATGIVPLDTVGVPKEIELTLAPPQRQEQKTPLPVVPQNTPLPDLIVPPVVPRAITEPPPPPPQKAAAPEGDIRALGRYLFNCSGANYESMSEQEKAHCLANRWNGKKPESAPVLGEAKPSPFDKVIQDRNAPFVPAFHPCAQDTIAASLHNVPCTNFESEHSILEENPGH